LPSPSALLLPLPLPQRGHRKLTAHTPAPPARKKHRRGGRLLATQVQLPVIASLLTPQTIPSVASGDASLAGLTPTPACSAFKVHPGVDAGVGGHHRAAGKPNESRDLRSVARPAVAEPPFLCLNGRCLGQRGSVPVERRAQHRLNAPQRQPRTDSYNETRRMFVVCNHA